MSDQQLSAVGVIAQETALKGVKIFPFDPLTKAPYRGFKDWKNQATTDLEIIRQWWTIWPDAMIAAPTGTINGFWVLDVDVGNGKQGMNSLRELEERYGPLPATMVVRTAGGGLHFYFSMPENGEIRNSESQIAPHIDVRGDGGCIIMAGSVRPNGKYEILKGDWRLQ